MTDRESGERQQLLSQSGALEITSLHPHYSYEVSVAAFTVDLGPFSQHIVLQTLEDGMLPFLCPIITHFTVPSGAPLNVAADANSSRSIRVQWDLPPPQQQNGDITGYVLRLIPITGGEGMDYETKGQFLFVDELSPHTTYECIVAARTSVGTGPFSAIVTIRTLEEGLKQQHTISVSVHYNITNFLYLYILKQALNK